MAKISIEDNVLIEDDIYRKICISVVEEGVQLVLVGAYHDAALVLQWDQLEDVEYLSTAFDNELVKVFKQVILMLGKVVANKETYMGLM